MNETKSEEQKMRSLQNMLALLGRKTLPITEPFYHYCSISTFKSIINSGTVWASHHKSMEDDSEMEVFFKILIERVNKRRTNDNESILNSFLRNWELNLKDYYIASFSTSNDLEDQWNKYADQGRGVCIGFSPDSFGIAHRIPSYCPSENTGIFKVEYFSENQYSIADLIVDNVLVIGRDFFPSVERFSLALKGLDFAQEKEVRIVEVQDSRVPLNPDFLGLRTRKPESCYKYRNIDDKEIPYREFPFRNENERACLHSITISPQSEITKQEILDVLNDCRLELAVGMLNSNQSHRRN